MRISPCPHLVAPPHTGSKPCAHLTHSCYTHFVRCLHTYTQLLEILLGIDVPWLNCFFFSTTNETKLDNQELSSSLTYGCLKETCFSGKLNKLKLHFWRDVCMTRHARWHTLGGGTTQPHTHKPQTPPTSKQKTPKTCKETYTETFQKSAAHERVSEV